MIDPEDFIAREAEDRVLEKASDPATWLDLRCPLCRCVPKPFGGEMVCACCLPVVR